jgi:hypothetical protein
LWIDDICSAIVRIRRQEQTHGVFVDGSRALTSPSNLATLSVKITGYPLTVSAIKLKEEQDTNTDDLLREEVHTAREHKSRG